MNKQTLIGFSLLLVLCFPGPGFADVKKKTGAFVITYVDIAYPGGLEPTIERTYNSKSQFRGMFGLGWHSKYESYLTITGYGPIVFHDFEQDEDFRYVPADWSITKPGEIADLIVAQATRARDVKDAAEASRLKTRLMRDPSLMDQYWKKYADQGLLKSRDLSLGSRLRSERFGDREITRDSDGKGYVHSNGLGGVEKFNEKGNLVEISDTDGDWIKLVLDENGRCRSLEESFGRKMVFRYSNNLVNQITATSPKTPPRIATYQYNARGEMTSSKDWKNIVYGHEYTAGKMSKISYPERTTREIAYYGPEAGDNVKSVKDPDGSTASYSYSLDKTDGHVIVDEVLRGASSRASVTRNKYEFFYQEKKSGERWNWRTRTTYDGASTDTKYHEECGCPTTIIEGGKNPAEFTYDNFGRVTRKVTPAEITELTYGKESGRVEFVKKYSPRQPDKATTAKFKYDLKGNLERGETDDGTGKTWFELEYDPHGRIKQLKDSANRLIMFQYNESSKPSHIQVYNVGEITITYEADGETFKGSEGKDVHGKAGMRNAALQVTAAFDLLTRITDLAKVSFSS